jgi:citrate lyase subunit beta/citryl-CoA lyase
LALLRSLLFVPASRQRTIDSAARSAADAVILDLEDGVAPAEKSAARERARIAIDALRGADKSAMVRVNSVDTGLARDDLMSVVREGLDAVVAPKVQQPQDLRDLDVLLREAEMANGVRPGAVGVIPIIESARAVLRCEAIAQAVDRLIGIAIGGEDYTADIGVERDAGGLALQHVRGVVVQVAVAYGLASIDAPYIDFSDERGLLRDAQVARKVGLKGKFVIHPGQIAAVNRVFSPTAREIARAKRIVNAYDSRASDVAAISVDGRMVDAPVAERARALLAFASAPRPRTKRLITRTART